MTYTIDALKDKIKQLTQANAKSSYKKEDGPKLTYWKPEVDVSTEIRFMPYDDGNSQPFQEVSYYDIPKMRDKRFVAPCQWGLPDPINELYRELKKEKQDAPTWNMMKTMRTKQSWYAPIYVRGQEDKGVQIWEMNKNVLMSVYSVLAHPDYSNENLMDPEKGYDFIVTVTTTGQQVEFKGKKFDRKNHDIKPRKNPSPLAKTKKERDALVASTPDLKEFFKKYSFDKNKLDNMVMEFLSKNDSSKSDESLAESTSEEVAETNALIEDAFKDL